MKTLIVITCLTVISGVGFYAYATSKEWKRDAAAAACSQARREVYSYPREFREAFHMAAELKCSGVL